MGAFEPYICPAGYYCPKGGIEQRKCPSGYFCPPGTYEPIACSVLGHCPEGSIKNITYLPVTLLILWNIGIALALCILWLKKLHLRKQKSWATGIAKKPTFVAKAMGAVPTGRSGMSYKTVDDDDEDMGMWIFFAVILQRTPEPPRCSVSSHYTTRTVLGPFLLRSINTEFRYPRIRLV